MTDSQIFKILSTANNGEIKQAKTALPKLKMDEAKKYAEMMIKEHSANEKCTSVGKSVTVDFTNQ